MYVSITGLKPKGILGHIRFWTLTIPAAKQAKIADGIVHSAFKSRKGFQHTLTVWQSRQHMLAYLTSPTHRKAMKNMTKIGQGKVYGYEADTIPSWEDALENWAKYGRIH